MSQTNNSQETDARVVHESLALEALGYSERWEELFGPHLSSAVTYRRA